LTLNPERFLELYATINNDLVFHAYLLLHRSKHCYEYQYHFCEFGLVMIESRPCEEARAELDELRGRYGQDTGEETPTSTTVTPKANT